MSEEKLQVMASEIMGVARDSFYDYILVTLRRAYLLGRTDGYKEGSGECFKRISDHFEGTGVKGH